MKAFFVTATGTGVGKTLVTCALAWQLKKRGKSVKVLKPVISGYDPENNGDSDTCLILDALGQPIEDAAIEAISPWRFSAALGPDQAAAIEGRKIDFDELVLFCRNAMTSGEDYLLIEGVGGAFVPLAGDKTISDWIAALNIPSVVVTGSYLGTQSHTISVLEAMRARELEINSIIVNDCADEPLPVKETMDALGPFTGTAKLIGLPRLRSSNQLWRDAPDELVEAVIQ